MTTNYKKALNDYVKKEKKWLLLILVISVIYSVMVLITPRITQRIIDDILPSNNSVLFWKYISILLFAYLFTIFVSIFKSYLSSKITENIKRNLRLDLINKMMDIKYTRLEKEGLGSYISKYENEAEIIAANCGTSIVQLFTNAFSVLLTCMAIYMINWQMLIITIGVMLVYLANNCYWGKRINKLSEQSLEATNNSINLFSDIYNNKLIVKIYNLYKKMSEKYRAIYLKQYKSSIKLEVTYYMNAHAGVALVYLLVVVVWIIGGIFYFEGTFSIGLIITLTSYEGMLISPINDISCFFNGYKETLVAVDRWYKVIELPKENMEQKKCLTDISKIEWQDVVFEYDKNESSVIKAGNFTVEKNSLIGIIGSSGCGKSTITKLLLRIIEKESGKILMNGIDIEDISIGAIRENITYVPQESMFFNDSIKENMFLKDPELQYEQFRFFCNKLQLLKYIDELPENWNSIIQTNGNNLSGGQKKRLDIVRALLSDAPVLIFDEPTASLDSNSREKFYELLKVKKQNKIIFIVTHNENEIKYFDKVLRVENEKIKEQRGM